jgi:ABC-type lipoprotein release transport system permease subunit
MFSEQRRAKLRQGAIAGILGLLLGVILAAAVLINARW